MIRREKPDKRKLGKPRLMRLMFGQFNLSFSIIIRCCFSQPTFSDSNWLIQSERREFDRFRAVNLKGGKNGSTQFEFRHEKHENCVKSIYGFSLTKFGADYESDIFCLPNAAHHFLLTPSHSLSPKESDFYSSMPCRCGCFCLLLVVLLLTFMWQSQEYKSETKGKKLNLINYLQTRLARATIQCDVMCGCLGMSTTWHELKTRNQPTLTSQHIIPSLCAHALVVDD